MQSITEQKTSVSNIIVADGCIDHIVLFDEKMIGYGGMDKSNLNQAIQLPVNAMGARLKPGAFEQLTKISAKKVMDAFIPLETIDADFDSDYLFSLEFAQAKAYFVDYLMHLVGDKIPNRFVNLFDELSNHPPLAANELYQKFNFSPRQCQRFFMRHFGISPQKVLLTLRLQYCMNTLLLGNASPNDILAHTGFYDQSHFINDFKRNIGLTPLAYLQMIRK